MKITIYDDEVADVLRALKNQCLMDIKDVYVPMDILDPLEYAQIKAKGESRTLDRYEHLCKVIKGEGTRRPAVKEPELLPIQEQQ